MQRNVLPQHEIACLFVSMPNGSTKVGFKLCMRVAYLNLTTFWMFYAKLLRNSTIKE